MIRGWDQKFEGEQSRPTVRVVRRAVVTNEATSARTQGMAAVHARTYPVKPPGGLSGRRIFVQDGAAGIEEGNSWPVVIQRMTRQ